MRSALDSTSPPPPPPPPPPHSSSYSPSLLIITTIVAFVIVTCAAIHILLRLLSRRPNLTSSSSPAFSPPPTPPALINRQPSTNDRKALIDSLPLFSLSSSAPRRSGDCAVCLSRLSAHDELRLLPACAHAFHSPCIDAWLLSTPSCPLCRSPVGRPPLPPDSDAGVVPVELGSVSDAAPEPGQHERRSYEVGQSFEEEVEVVVARLRRASEARVTKDEVSAAVPPGEEMAEAAGGGSRGWLRDYVDRLASSASSSFRFSGRWSRRFESGDAEHSGRAGRRDSWDIDDDENGYSASFYRWLTGGAQA